MKIGPGTKINKKKHSIAKNFKSDVITAKCNIIVTFPIYGRFGTIRRVDLRLMFCNTYISINSNLLSYKDWKQNEKISNTASMLLLDGLGTKRMFSRTTYVCILTDKT